MPAGQQPLDTASYFSHGSSPNPFVVYNPNLAFLPGTTQFQGTASCFLGQIPEENPANHYVDSVEGNVTQVGSSEGDSDSSFEKVS